MRIHVARLVVATLALSVSLAGHAADRNWQTGKWHESDARTYIIVAGSVRIHLEDVPPTGTRAIEATAGSPVKFAVEGNRAFVLDQQGSEHELRVLRTVDLNYTATGAGHFIKSMSANGLMVTLEDNSVWDLDPQAQFFTIEWQPFDGISVRRSAPEHDFNYGIDNTDRDNGALARYSPP